MKDINLESGLTLVLGNISILQEYRDISFIWIFGYQNIVFSIFIVYVVIFEGRKFH